MATATIPKSEMRQNFNVQRGYGEVPGFIQRGAIVYALPCGTITDSITRAEEAAAKIDAVIRQCMKANPKRNLH